MPGVEGRVPAPTRRRAFQPGTIGQSEGVDPPPIRPHRTSNIDHPKKFWSRHGYRGCISIQHTQNEARFDRMSAVGGKADVNLKATTSAFDTKRTIDSSPRASGRLMKSCRLLTL